MQLDNQAQEELLGTTIIQTEMVADDKYYWFYSKWEIT